MRVSSKPLRRRRARRSRAGVALVMFAMLVFLFLAVAGIAIDVGMASLTQQQMQVAVDTAALEGMRLRDFDEYQFLSDQGRRPKVSQLVRYVFDDDFHPSQGGRGYPEGNPSLVPAMPPDDADKFQLGAGPMMQITGGQGPYEASGLITTPNTRVWDDPILQTNAINNRVDGDMVSGLYRPNAFHFENSDYTRPDFGPGTAPDARWRSLAFLVRMRRTNSAADQVANVSTHAPTVPFMFGLGSLMRQEGSGWNPRKQGMTVRATAIAVATPAFRVSPRPLRPNPLNPAQPIPINNESSLGVNPMLGVYPFAIEFNFWTTVVMPGTWPSQSHVLLIQTTSAPGLAAGDLKLSTGQPVGRLMRNPTDPNLPPEELATSVGRRLPSAYFNTATLVSPGYVPTSGYVPIYAAVMSDGGALRVVGFAFADASLTNGQTTLTFKAGISAQPGSSTSNVQVWVAANGTSSHLSSNPADLPSLTKEQWDEVFRKNKQLAYGGSNNPFWNASDPNSGVTYDYAYVRPGTLLAPALAR